MLLFLLSGGTDFHGSTMPLSSSHSQENQRSNSIRQMLFFLWLGTGSASQAIEIGTVL